jgi:RNA polymerase sigma factor (sigma-70 family)
VWTSTRELRLVASTRGWELLQRFLEVRTLVVVRNLSAPVPNCSTKPGFEALFWDQALDGNGDAFGQLFDLHRDRVFRHAWGLAGNRQDAEDVIASAFLELWRLRQRVRLVEGSVLPWLLATTTNIGLNAARSRRRYQRFLERLPRKAEEADVADSTRGLGITPVLREAMRTLRPKDAQLLALVALEGYAVNEAAICLDLSPEAARARLHRARRRLQEVLRHEPAVSLLIEEMRI